MDVLLVSDTHGSIDPRLLSAAGAADLVVHAGDIGDRAVLDALSAVAPRVLMVRGNNDIAAKWPAGDQAVLDRIPWRAAVRVPGGVLVVDHGHRHGPPGVRHARLRAAYPEARAVVYGHSHHACVDDADRPWVLNPGAAGRVRTFGGPAALWLTATAGAWSVGQVQLPPG